MKNMVDSHLHSVCLYKISVMIYLLRLVHHHYRTKRISLQDKRKFHCKTFFSLIDFVLIFLLIFIHTSLFYKFYCLRFFRVLDYYYTMIYALVNSVT